MGYQRPTVKDLGTLEDLTLQNVIKDFTGNDGFALISGVQLGPVS